MKSFLFKSYSLLLTAALLLSLQGNVNAQNSIIADCENGMQQTNWSGYWYVFEDNNHGGNSLIVNATKNSNGYYDFLPTQNQGSPHGTPGYGVMMEYKFGNQNPSTNNYPWGSLVGLGMTLNCAKDPVDFTGATAVTFWAKADKPANVRVEIGMMEVDDYCYHHVIVPVTTEWEKYSVALTDSYLKQYEWGRQVLWSPENIMNINWALSEDEDNEADVDGKLWVDDVEVEDFE